MELTCTPCVRSVCADVQCFYYQCYKDGSFELDYVRALVALRLAEGFEGAAMRELPTLNLSKQIYASVKGLRIRSNSANSTIAAIRSAATRIHNCVTSQKLKLHDTTFTSVEIYLVVITIRIVQRSRPLIL